MLSVSGFNISGLNLSDYYTCFLVFVVPALLFYAYAGLEADSRSHAATPPPSPTHAGVMGGPAAAEAPVSRLVLLI